MVPQSMPRFVKLVVLTALHPAIRQEILLRS